MAAFGSDFKGGLFRKLFNSQNHAGLAWALGAFVIIFALNLFLQGILTIAVLRGFLGGELGDMRQLVKANIISIFPASIPVAAFAWYLAKVRGGSPKEVLNLRWPDLGAAGWLLLIAGFLVAMYAAVFAVIAVFDIDLKQYTPGPYGESPETGSAGAVKEAMFEIANSPMHFMLALLSVGIGAPLAEELIFRGQIFTALARTQLGLSGTVLLTSAAWSLMHYSEPWLSIGLIFVMGLVFGLLLIRFGSLWVTMACHAIWNTVFSLTILLGVEA